MKDLLQQNPSSHLWRILPPGSSPELCLPVSRTYFVIKVSGTLLQQDISQGNFYVASLKLWCKNCHMETFPPRVRKLNTASVSLDVWIQSDWPCLVALSFHSHLFEACLLASRVPPAHSYWPADSRQFCLIQLRINAILIKMSGLLEHH